MNTSKMKKIETVGPEDVQIRVKISVYNELLEASKCALKELNKLGATCQHLERAIQKAEE